MPFNTGPAAGEYDPVRASIIHQVRTQSASNEAKITPVEFTKRHIKVRSQNSGREVQVETQATSYNVSYLRMRRDSVTEQIKPDWEIHHRSGTWKIIAPNPIDYATGELEFICQALFPVT